MYIGRMVWSKGGAAYGVLITIAIPALQWPTWAQ
jgi:hypothetical protein